MFLTLYSIFAYLIDTGIDCKRAFINDACTCILSTQEPDCLVIFFDCDLRFVFFVTKVSEYT